MVDMVTTIQLAGSALGALGAVMLFAEFFQLPSYLKYKSDIDSYTLEMAPAEVYEYSWLGRIGALLLAVAFALQFLATLLA